jgi:hypothetical protein
VFYTILYRIIRFDPGKVHNLVLPYYIVKLPIYHIICIILNRNIQLLYVIYKYIIFILVKNHYRGSLCEDNYVAVLLVV